MTPGPRAGFSALEFGLCFLFIAAAMLLVLSLEPQVGGRARIIACSSNLKQLSAAMALYATDHGGRGPLAPVPEALQPYVRNDQIFLCPVDETTGYRESERSPVSTSYQFPVGWWNDDPPWVVVAGDDRPDRHLGRTWIGAQADGAVRVYPAQEWQALE